MKRPQGSTTKKSTRGQDNPAQLPRIRKLFAVLHLQQKNDQPGKRWHTLGQLAKLIQGNDSAPMSDDTMGRVLAMMRDQLNMPVHFVPERRGHGFTEPVANFPFDVISEEQVYSLIQAVQMLEAFRESKVFKEMREVVKKACLGVTFALGVEFEDIEKALSYHLVGFDAPAPVDPVLFKSAIRAILKQQEVTLEHRSVKRPGEVSQKTIEPLHLAMINNAMYLFHWDSEAPIEPGQTEEDARIRKFALTRISQLKPTRRKCKPRAFNVKERVDRGMGAWDEESGEPINIRFTPKIAPLILERRWHPKQVVTRLADGSLTMILPVARTPELEAFVLRWAGSVEVVGPTPVRKRMRELGEALVKAHQVESEMAA